MTILKLHKRAVLLIGGAGYIGSHMVNLLVENGYQVVILDNFSTGFHELVHHSPQIVTGDLGDIELLDQIFSKWHFNAVMHFAAFSQVGESVQDPLKYFSNNVAATIILLRAMVKHDIKKFIFSSSAAVYGEPEAIPIGESHLCRPANPYGDSKLAVERMLASLDSAYGVRSICLRYFNAAGAHPSGKIGEMHNPETHLIPLALKAAGASTPLKIFGSDYPTKDGTCVRDYVHVCDLAKAHLLALEYLDNGGKSDVFNLGNSVGYSVRQVVELAMKVAGKKIAVEECGRRSGDPAVLVADSTKIRKRLGWKPQYEDLKAIMETAWKWQCGRS